MTKNAFETVTGYSERLKRHLDAAVGSFVLQTYYAGYDTRPVGALQCRGRLA